MDINEVKLETITNQILDESAKGLRTRTANGKYYVRLKDSEEVSFDESFKSVVDDAIHQAARGDRTEQSGKYENVNGRLDNAYGTHLTD